MQYIRIIVTAFLAAAGIPSALFAYYLRKIEKRRADEEAAPKQYEQYQVKMLIATEYSDASEPTNTMQRAT